MKINEKEIFFEKFNRLNRINIKSQNLFETKKSIKRKYFSHTEQRFTKIPQLTTYSTFYTKKNNISKNTENSNSFSKVKSVKGIFLSSNYLDRINYLKKIYLSEKFQNFIKERPTDSKFESITDYLVDFRKKNNELESAMMAFYFVCHEIKYLKNNQNMNIKFSQKAENVFYTKKALSFGFSNLFEHFLKKMEIKFKRINGYCKLIPKDNSNFVLSINSFEDNLTPSEKEIEKINHCWEAVYINREWCFVDTLLGSGGVNAIHNDKDQFLQVIDPFSYYENNFSPYYFMIPIKELIFTHRPSQDFWQFNEKILSYKQFMNRNFYIFNKFYSALYKTDIELITHKEPIIKILNKENLVIKLRLKDSLLSGDIYNSTGKEKISELKFNYNELEEYFIFEYTFSISGEFIIKINFRSVNSTDLIYWPLIDYVVKVQDKLKFTYFDRYKTRIKTESTTQKKYIKDLLFPKLNKTEKNNIRYKPKIITDYMKFFPSKINKKVCYDNEGFILIEPKINILKKGTKVKFKLRMKGALNIAILDGINLYYLKKSDKNIFYGEKEIKTDNVSICCLKGKHLFTEVYKFKSLKEKSFDSKLFFMRLKGKKI